MFTAPGGLSIAFSDVTVRLRPLAEFWRDIIGMRRIVRLMPTTLYSVPESRGAV